MRDLARKILPAILLLAILAYAVDYAVWRVRVARGTGMATIALDQYLSTALKGNKDEYDYLGAVQQPCAVALAPHGGAKPCWWLRRHTSQWE